MTDKETQQTKRWWQPSATLFLAALFGLTVTYWAHTPAPPQEEDPVPTSSPSPPVTSFEDCQRQLEVARGQLALVQARAPADNALRDPCVRDELAKCGYADLVHQ